MIESDIEPLLQALSKLDCGSQSCYFAKETKGQRVTCGCRCLQGLNPAVRLEIMKLWHPYKKLIQERGNE